MLQHAAAALDEVRRQEFFRAGAVMRRYGRGKRWLLLRRWKTARGSKRRELQPRPSDDVGPTDDDQPTSRSELPGQSPAL